MLVSDGWLREVIKSLVESEAERHDDKESFVERECSDSFRTSAHRGTQKEQF